MGVGQHLGVDDIQAVLGLVSIGLVLHHQPVAFLQGIKHGCLAVANAADHHDPEVGVGRVCEP